MDRISAMKLARVLVLLGLTLSAILTSLQLHTAAVILQVPFLLISEISAWMYFRTPRDRRSALFRSDGPRMYTSALHPYYLLVLSLAVHTLSIFWMLA